MNTLICLYLSISDIHIYIYSLFASLITLLYIIPYKHRHTVIILTIIIWAITLPFTKFGTGDIFVIIFILIVGSPFTLPIWLLLRLFRKEENIDNKV